MSDVCALNFKMVLEELPYIAKFFYSILFTYFVNEANLRTFLSQKFIFQHDILVMYMPSSAETESFPGDKDYASEMS